MTLRKLRDFLRRAALFIRRVPQIDDSPRWFLGTQLHLWRQRPPWVNRFRWAVSLLVGLAGDLVDMDVMIESVPKVYSHVTGGLLSKHLYHADVVIGEADAYTDRLIAEAIEDEREEWGTEESCKTTT